jgi:hypothetical protein
MCWRKNSSVGAYQQVRGFSFLSGEHNGEKMWRARNKVQSGYTKCNDKVVVVLTAQVTVLGVDVIAHAASAPSGIANATTAIEARSAPRRLTPRIPKTNPLAA